MKYITRFNDILAKIETTFLIAMLLTMVVLAFLQVILRNFFATSIFWGDIFLRHLVLWVGFLGASLAIREGKHINIDVLSRFLSPQIKRISGIIVNLFSSAVCVFLTDAALRFIKEEVKYGGELFAGIPIWIFQSIIVIGFGLMVIRFFIQALKLIFERDVIAPKESRG